MSLQFSVSGFLFAPFQGNLETENPKLKTAMGKGDRKTKRGKIWCGSYGKRRPAEKRKPQPAAKPAETNA